ncbi:phosphate/phosphite/phosphonate ABC transporter substrate-binding protein [Oceaniglobus trochenteri]|uniref:phosphate/phosphite/phosphonate ABC transporter substrate-binding protein n=1 Tax=Oceaniglobus trochenteri TaxID=2763260 RepID=UPI001D0019F4|nr:PhnD/SsuA/transferrin family substrate-binding protein [Oceaniglobus trochenteri]
MIASLPMYDRAETSAAHDALWALLRDRLHDRGIDAPARLTRGPDLWAEWESGDLLLGQTCNLPLRARLHPRVALVGNPDLALDDTPPGHYHSLIVTRAGEPTEIAQHAHGRFALNDAMSHSGWGAAQVLARRHGFTFARTLETGAHSASAAALAEGRADIAAIDAHTWRSLLAYDSHVTDRLQVIGRTEASPAPPYITAFPQLVPVLLRALSSAIAALPAAHRATLGLAGVVQVPLAAHLSLPNPPEPRRQGRETGASATSEANSALQSVN